MRSSRKRKSIEYNCIYCNEKFNNLKELKSHIYENGDEKKHLFCELCNEEIMENDFILCKLCNEEVMKRDFIVHFNKHKYHFQQKGKGVKKRLLKNNKILVTFCFYQ